MIHDKELKKHVSSTLLPIPKVSRFGSNLRSTLSFNIKQGGNVTAEWKFHEQFQIAKFMVRSNEP